MFLKHKVDEKEPRERSAAWYADPYGGGARRAGAALKAG
jgi:hypothetical protein